MNTNVATDEMKVLFDNCASGNTNLVQEFLEVKGNVDRRNKDDVTALQVAAANGQNNVVKVLISKGASLEKYNNKKWTSLLHAARNGHSEVIETLINHQINVNSKTGLGANALLIGCRKGDKETCRVLMRGGIDAVHNDDPLAPECHLTPLMVACFSGHESLVKFLLTSRISGVNEQSASLGVSPLMLAALANHQGIVRYLLSKGADANQTDINAKTALEYAMLRKHQSIIDLLSNITHVKSNTVCDGLKNDIIEAAKKGNFQQLREILETDLGQRDSKGGEEEATALMYACMSGRLDMVEELVEKGCSLDEQDGSSGWTALMQAVFHGKKSVAKYLIKSGANVHISCKNGYTAFDLISLLDEVDSELYRLLAAATMETKVPPVSGHNGTVVNTTKSTNASKSHLKLWWTKLSGRLKSMKITATNNDTTTINNNNNNTLYNSHFTLNTNTTTNSNFDIIAATINNNNNININDNTNTSYNTNNKDLKNVLNHSIASTAHLKSTLSSINSSKPQEDNTERFYPKEEYNTKPIINNKHTTSIQVHRQDNTLNNIKSKYNALKSIRFTNNSLKKPNLKNVITLKNTVSTYNDVTSVVSMKNTSAKKTVCNEILTLKNISSPLKLFTIYSEVDDSFNKNAYLTTGKQTNARITSNNVNFTEKKLDHHNTIPTITDSTPKFLPPPPSQLKLQSLKMPSLPREHKHIYNKKDHRTYNQSPVGEEDGWRNEAVLSNINTASVIHSSTINKLKVKCLKKRKKQSVSPSSSSDSNQLTSSLMTSSNAQMTRQQLALLAAATSKSHSKMHSSASSSTGTLTAGSGSMGRSFESGMKPAHSESSTLVDEEVEDLPPLFHLLSHTQTSHTSTVKSPEMSELKFDRVKNKIYHETKHITTKEDQQNIQHKNNNNIDNKNNKNTYSYTQNITEKNTDKHRDKQPDDDLSLHLKELSLHQFQTLFDQHEIDMETFMELTESNLEELGIMHDHSRKILLQSIKRRKEQSSGL